MRRASVAPPVGGGDGVRVLGTERSGFGGARGGERVEEHGPMAAGITVDWRRAARSWSTIRAETVAGGGERIGRDVCLVSEIFIVTPPVLGRRRPRSPAGSLPLAREHGMGGAAEQDRQPAAPVPQRWEREQPPARRLQLPAQDGQVRDREQGKRVPGLVLSIARASRPQRRLGGALRGLGGEVDSADHGGDGMDQLQSPDGRVDIAAQQVDLGASHVAIQ